ncbi:MAG: outer membrane beta-barrel protein [Elusimicrobiota bacterium]
MRSLLAGVLLLASAHAGAAQNIRLGNIQINPLVSVQQKYDTNIYLSKVEKSAWVNRTGLGLNLVSRAGSRLDLTGGYTLEFLSYSRAPANNNATHHLANIAVKARMFRDVVAILNDSYMLNTDQATSELVERAQRVQNIVSFNLAAPIRGNFGFKLAAQHTYYNYLSSRYNLLDRNEILMGGDLTYKLQPKTQLVLGYRHGTLNYRLASAGKGDSVYDNLDLGLAGNIAPKLMGTVKAGVQFRNYNKNLTLPKSNTTTAGYSVQVLWKPVSKTEVIIYGRRGNIETSYLNTRFYTSTLSDITFSRQVHKIKAGLGLSYETMKYPGTATASGRTDTLTNMRLTGEYNIQKWLKAGLDYTRKQRKSILTYYNYSDNLFGFTLTGMF